MQRCTTFRDAILTAVCATGLITGATAARADEPPASAPPAAATPALKPTLALVGGRWFNGTRFAPATWYVVDGRFTARRPRRIDATIHLRGRYALPPLAEAHNHNLQNVWSLRRMADDYLRRGVFYTAQMGASTTDITGFRTLLDAPGNPDVLWAEALFTASDGHPLGIALAGARAAGMPLTAADLIDKTLWAVDTPADVAAKWPRIAEARPKLIKIIIVDADDEAARHDPAEYGRLGVRPELVGDLTKRAHAIGARVAAHVQTAADARVAVEAGVDILAHLPGMTLPHVAVEDLRMDDATIAAMARRGTIAMPTVEVYRRIAVRRPDEWARIFPIFRDNVARLRSAGVPLLTGSDLWGGSVLDEMKGLVETGLMTRQEALQASVETTALALFPDRAIGRIAEGAEASFIAVDRNPALDLGALDRIAMAMKQGELVSR